VSVFDNDPSRGNVTFKATVSKRLKGLPGPGHASDLIVTGDGLGFGYGRGYSLQVVRYAQNEGSESPADASIGLHTPSAPRLRGRFGRYFGEIEKLPVVTTASVE
jgi:hypothetical protein